MLGVCWRVFSWGQARQSGPEAAEASARVRGPKLAATEPGPGRRARAGSGPVISVRRVLTSAGGECTVLYCAVHQYTHRHQQASSKQLQVSVSASVEHSSVSLSILSELS